MKTPENENMRDTFVAAYYWECAFVIGNSAY